MENSYIDPCKGDQVSIEIVSPNLDDKLEKELQKSLPTSPKETDPMKNVEQEILAGREIESSQALDIGKTSSTQRSIDKSDLITLTFKDLSYSVQVKNSTKKKDQSKVEMKELLKGITGICRPRELTAIMGASGAGKTTLLNILSLRVSSKGKNKLTGQYLANGKTYTVQTFSKFAGYVMQNDILLATMTPREVFEFTAQLRLHGSAEERKKKVNQLIEDLKLERAADTMIGGELSKGISGGERKRTSIGVELMTDPNLMFLDEPTSGLDSFTAFRLIHLLKDLAAREGKTIVFTIHQPSTDVFFMFDVLMILAKGKFIYQGPAQQTVNYFTSIGYPCPEYSNPADHFIQIAHSDGNDEKFEGMYKAYDEKLAPAINQEVDSVQKGEMRLHEKVNGFFVSSGVVAKRSFRNFLRHPILLRGRIVQTIFITFLICCIYFQIHDTDESKQNTLTGMSQVIYDINGALFFFSISLFAMSCMSVILTFPTERAVFLKEHSSNMYGVSSYFIGRSSTELPFVILFPILMTAVSYYIIGFNPGVDRFFIFMLILVFVSIAGNAVGLLAGSIFSDPKVASNVAPAFLLPMMIFAGFYVNAESMPAWLGWLQYLSPFRYSLEAFMWNEYSGSRFGTAQLVRYNYQLGLWTAFILLVVLGLGFRIFALISLKLLVRRLQ